MKTLTQVTTAPAFKPWELAEVQKHLSLDLATLKTQPNVCQYTKHTVPGCVCVCMEEGGGGGLKVRVGLEISCVINAFSVDSHWWSICKLYKRILFIINA